MLVCCGEALIDMIPAECGEAGEAGFVPRPGGSVFTTAVALGRLGANPRFLSCLSSDMFGRLLEGTLQDSHVDLSLCLHADRPTTMAYVHLADGHANYFFHDENSAVRMILAGDLPEIPREAKALFFGGISLVSEPCADTFAGLAEREGGSRVVMVDPNIRPAFIADESRFRARLNRVFQAADIVKVSDEDLEWLVPGEPFVRQRAQAILDYGPAMVLVTEGGKGASCHLSDGRVLTRPTTPRQVVDTVGAGDSFNAGFLHSLQSRGLLEKSRLADLTDKQILEALGLGSAVAGVVVSRSGANPPWAEELEHAS